MNKNPLLKLHEFGQSIWLDFIRRGMLSSGEFQSLIDGDGLLGVTSNPSIFEKAIAGSRDYDEAIRAAARDGLSSQEIYSLLTIQDIQKAADLFHRVFEKTQGQDGFVSLEVSPHLAYDTEGTINEARKLWKTVSRPNVLIKVPATAPGLPAIRQLISEGINVNITLLFSLARYDEVIDAYISGLETRIQAGNPIGQIASVASFFLSRIDLAVDPLLSTDSTLRGQTAIASAKMAYQKYKSVFEGERFKKLKKQGAKTQRLLWASTSTKNPNESDVKYVEALIGAETVNTLPLETLNAYRDHGDPACRLETDIFHASKTLECLSQLKIDLRKITQELEDEGVHKFNVAFDKLMTSLEIKRNTTTETKNNGSTEDQPVSLANREDQPLTLDNCADQVQKRLAQLKSENYCQRVWRKDASLWKADAASQAIIKKSLGWLHIAEKMEQSAKDLKDFVQEIRTAGFQHVVHMGMGGSSLAPLVFSRTFSSQDGLPLTVLDTTDPTTIKKIEDSIPLEKTLFIVASKSGTTAEPLAFKDYFYERLRAIKVSQCHKNTDGNIDEVTDKDIGKNFIAITDPGTPLVRAAEEQKFRRVFLNAADIGGRYSALSYFGLVPAALMGVNIHEILARALQSANSSISQDSPAMILGAALGEMGLQKRNKITLLVDKPLQALGLWLEQLLAESTGKEGTGLIPIANEPLGAPSVYGEDRLFIYLSLKSSESNSKDNSNESVKNTVSALRQAHQPVVTIPITDTFDLGREFFQWEFATALAGSILKIDAFDQPNVQESKDNTNRLLSQNAEQPPQEKPVLSADALIEFLKKANPGDYVALMAFLPECPATDEILQGIRKNLRDKLKCATTLGYGPRFLHSTGQLHKGGPNTGLFLQLTADNISDISIPGRPYTFGFFKQAQAQGDLEALRKHGRRVTRIHLGSDVEKGLKELESQVNLALRSL